jgi:succinate-semialdehyde dehydrogenase/glutarate-semialdehyde dehydrogenase
MITPWNYPLTLPLSDAIPALLAGNGVVLKPDHQTPFSALCALKLLFDAGLPRDLFQVVIGDGPSVGGAIIENADFVMFTGSTATGKLVAEKAAARLIGFSAELGGKNPMIVLDDAPLSRAVQGAINASFSNAGQLCMSIERLYVQDSIYDTFVPGFVDAVKGLSMGIQRDFSAKIGSLISAEQLEKVSGHVNDAVSRGATVLAGGKHRPDIGPYVFEPTVLENVTEDMLLCRGETFGPVVAIYRFHSDDEAVALANDTTYGLNASVWGSPKRARALARQIVGHARVGDGSRGAAARAATGAKGNREQRAAEQQQRARGAGHAVIGTDSASSQTFQCVQHASPGGERHKYTCTP